MIYWRCTMKPKCLGGDRDELEIVDEDMSTSKF